MEHETTELSKVGNMGPSDNCIYQTQGEAASGILKARCKKSTEYLVTELNFKSLIPTHFPPGGK